jgi:hypothetical protein
MCCLLPTKACKKRLRSRRASGVSRLVRTGSVKAMSLDEERAVSIQEREGILLFIVGGWVCLGEKHH